MNDSPHDDIGGFGMDIGIDISQQYDSPSLGYTNEYGPHSLSATLPSMNLDSSPPINTTINTPISTTSTNHNNNNGNTNNNNNRQTMLNHSDNNTNTLSSNNNNNNGNNSNHLLTPNRNHNNSNHSNNSNNSEHNQNVPSHTMPSIDSQFGLEDFNPFNPNEINEMDINMIMGTLFFIEYNTKSIKR